MDVRHYRTDLFPEIEPYASGRLPLGGSHLMYWEQSGNPRGTPILFLHGGPGAGAAAAHRRFFDPRHYRIVIFDQRGCGRSAPHGELADNSTSHLVNDIEALRRHLNIDRWIPSRFEDVFWVLVSKNEMAWASRFGTLARSRVVTWNISPAPSASLPVMIGVCT